MATKPNKTTINNRNRQRGKDFEKKVARELNMDRVPYSGSSEAFGFGDIMDKYHGPGFWLGEAKSITPKNKNQVNVTLETKWFGDIEAKARKAGRLPFLVHTLYGSPKAHVSISLWLFRLLAIRAGILLAEPVVPSLWADLVGTILSNDNSDVTPPLYVAAMADIRVTMDMLRKILGFGDGVSDVELWDRAVNLGWRWDYTTNLWYKQEVQ